MKKNILVRNLVMLLSFLLITVNSYGEPIKKKFKPLVNLEDAIEAKSITATYDKKTNAGYLKVTPADCSGAECKELFFTINDSTQINNRKRTASIDELIARVGKPAVIFYKRNNPKLVSKISW